jgi:hypothetical protein
MDTRVPMGDFLINLFFVRNRACKNGIKKAENIFFIALIPAETRLLSWHIIKP